LLFKNASIKERANAALSGLQRNAHAMSMLRSRLESRINFTLNGKAVTDTYQELVRLLELVKNGELILYEMSEKIESARFLEEFIVIIESASSSVGDLKGDLQHMVPAAEAALEEIHEAVSKVSLGLPADLPQEIEPTILAEVTATRTMGDASTGIKVQEKAMLAREAEQKEEPEPVPARSGIGANNFVSWTR
jgi:hypothetical protein